MKHTTLLFLFFILNMQAFSQDNKYKDIIDQLFIIDNDDQKYRVEIQDIETKYGLHSRHVDSLWTLLNKTDSINLIKVKAILDKYGWLGINDIGSQCNTTLFMVIQHADLKTHWLEGCPTVQGKARGKARGPRTGGKGHLGL